MNATEPQYDTVWVCTDCMLHEATGACGGCQELDRGHHAPPLRLLDMDRTAAGIMRAEHYGPNLCGDVDECDCATDPFGRFACEGCGSTLAGVRHGMTVFER